MFLGAKFDVKVISPQFLETNNLRTIHFYLKALRRVFLLKEFRTPCPLVIEDFETQCLNYLIKSA